MSSVKISISLADVELEDALERIEELSGFIFVYSSNNINTHRKISLYSDNESVAEVLRQIFEGRRIRIVQKGRHIMLKKHFFKLKVERIPEHHGSLSGKIVDIHTGESLPGASVYLMGSPKGTCSNLDGHFQLDNIPPGEHSVIVSYLGYEKVSFSFHLEPEMAVSRDFLLKPGISLSAVTITGNLEGQGKALNQQKMALNIKNVVSSSLIGRFPDRNVAEALQRLSGINVERNRGEGSIIQLRGTPPGFTITTINGEQIPSTVSDGSRYEELDLIPIDQVSSIEVIKAITPENDIDAIAGAVNLKTTKAKKEDNKFRLEAGTGYNQLSEKYNVIGSFSYSNRFFDKDDKNGKFGIKIGGSLYNTQLSRDRLEIKDWKKQSFVNTDNESYDTYVIGSKDLRHRDLLGIRSRQGFYSYMDYTFNKKADIFFHLMHSRLSDDDIRRRNRYRPKIGEYLSPDTVLGGTMRRDITDRFIEKKITTAHLGGNVAFNLLEMDYSIFHSSAIKDYNSKISTFESEPFDFRIHNLRDYNVYVEALDSEIDIHDPQLIKDFRFHYHDHTVNQGTNSSFRMNFSYPFLFSSNEVTLKWGGKYRLLTNERSRINESYNIDRAPEQEEDLFARLMGTYEDQHFFNNSIRFGPGLSASKMNDFIQDNIHTFDKNEEATNRSSDLYSYSAKENIYSGYAMFTMDVGSFDFISGLRMESSDVKYQAKKVFDYNTPHPSTTRKNFHYLMPNVHINYRINNYSNARFAYTMTYTRPEFEKIVPFRFIDSENDMISAGNPDLLPANANNFDLSYEKYLKNLGILSGNFFYKLIRSFHFSRIIPLTYEMASLFQITEPTKWQYIREENGESVHLYGFEVNIQKNLSELINGFGIYANYTFTESNAFTQYRQNISLPGQANHVGNVALTYDNNKFSGRISLNYYGDYVLLIGENNQNDIYRKSRHQLDINGFYKINDNLSLFAEFLNITNPPQIAYHGTPERAYEVEYYGWWSRFGITFKF
jgi:TonB-dependent receptor